MKDEILVEQLSKTYQVPEREGGFTAAVRGFFRRKYRSVQAVQQVSFHIRPGEIVGFLGPNGAGKTTTLKMLSGLLHPSGGKAGVLGLHPLGAQTRLSPIHDPGDGPAQPPLLGHPRRRFVPAQPGHLPHHRDRLQAVPSKSWMICSSWRPSCAKPVRNLSLGERMKVELAAGLLHRPRSFSWMSRPSAWISPLRRASALSCRNTTAAPARRSCSPAITWRM